MKKTMILLMVSVLAFVLGATSVLGIVPENTTVTVQGNDVTFTTSVASVTADGGNITNMSMNQTAQSSYWQAFYGDIVKTIFLADTGATNILYDWGAQSLGGWVFFSNETGIDWSAVVAGDQTDKEDEDAALGLTGNAESVNGTLTATTHSLIPDVGGASIGANTANSTTTSSNGGTDWTTVILRGGAASTDAVIYAGEVQQNNQNYVGNAVDYQVIVPVVQSTGTRSYNVYAALE